VISGGFVVDVAAAIVTKIRNRPKAVARRAARTARKAKRPRQPDEAAGEFFQQENDDMDKAIVGALKSKLVWLGIVQIGYSLFETWANGGLNAEAVSTAISGVLTILFRAMTTTSLADKAKPSE
jgi:hypothetical protein